MIRHVSFKGDGAFKNIDLMVAGSLILNVALLHWNVSLIYMDSISVYPIVVTPWSKSLQTPLLTLHCTVVNVPVLSVKPYKCFYCNRRVMCGGWNEWWITLLTLKKQFLYVIPNGISGMAVGELRKISIRSVPYLDSTSG